MENRIRPILFSSPMVQSLINKSKKQTRREIKSSSSETFALMMNILCGADLERSKEELLRVNSPYQIGDILWVRETYKIGAWDDEQHSMSFNYKASPDILKSKLVEFQDLGKFSDMHVKAIEELDALGISPRVDEENERIYYKWKTGQSPLKWKPSIFMPKEACRLFLKVTEVRIECLNDISETDAVQEGIERMPQEHWWRNYLNDPLPGCSMAKESFKTLWQSINGKASWKTNPLVWVIKFEPVKRPSNFLV